MSISSNNIRSENRLNSALTKEVVTKDDAETKIKAAALAVIFLLFVTACDLGITLGTQARIEPLPVITVPGSTLPVDFLTLSVGLALASPNLDLGAGENFVSFVRVRNLRLDILDLSEQDPLEDGALDSFDFLSGIDVSIRANFNGRENELLIATLPDGDPQIGTAARSLDLTVVNSNTDVLDFLLAPEGYDVVLNFIGNVPTDDIILSGELRYRLGIGF